MRLAVVALGSLAILFAPATGEDSGSLSGREPIGARILAPTVSEAIVAVTPRLAPQVPAASQAASVLALILAAAIAASLIGAPHDRAAGTGSRVSVARTWIPRGPPPLRTV
jgi:hypothetical protein